MGCGERGREGQPAPDNAYDWPWRTPDQSTDPHLPVAYSHSIQKRASVQECKIGPAGTLGKLLTDDRNVTPALLLRSSCTNMKRQPLMGDRPTLNAGNPIKCILKLGKHSHKAGCALT